MTLVDDRNRSGAPEAGAGRLVDRFERGLDAPICLTWELTYACNLACVHCLSSSGRRDPDELTTAECKALIDEFERMQIFYVNIGGGEPTVRADFWELVEYATDHHVGVKFSTNGSRITAGVAERLAGSDYVDVQISLDGATAAVNDAVRGAGSFATAVTAMERLAAAGFAGFKLSVVVTRHNVTQLDAFKSLADSYGAQLRLTRLRPSGRGADVWDELHPTAGQQRTLYDWLVGRGEDVLTGDSFFHLAGYGEPLPGLNLCGAGRRGLPGRSGRCRVRLPLRHPRPVPGRQRTIARRLRRGLAPFGTLPRAAPAAECRSMRIVRAVRRLSAAVAWRQSSSPASRSTGPTPNACSVTASTRWPPADRRRRPGRRPITRGVRGRSPVALLPRQPDRACDESPLASFEPGPTPG